MRSRLVQAAAFLLVSFGLFIAVAAFLYHYNNKYENTMVYPMGGVVFLDDGTLNQDKPLFLAHQWNCYPDKQYTPEDFKKGSVENGSYITLGSYANFSYGDPERETQGSCTYRLTLSLPEAPATYTLYMPEVFSAYTLYLNDTKALTLGNPDPGNYRDEVGNQTISFTASGTLHITMIVTNYSHVYSGMVYPPAFGKTPVIEKYLSTRLLMTGAYLTIMVLLGVFSLFFAWQLKQTYAYGFAAVCGVCFLVSCYPVFFSYGTWPVRPWYVLEVVCLMGVYPLIARIQGKIVKLPQRLIQVETGILSGGMVLAGVFFMFGAGNARFGQIYALLLFLYKTGCALCLLYQAFRAYRKEVCKTPVLLVGTVLFGASLVADRMYPGYEPIYGGWFQEIGLFMLVLSIGYELAKDLARTYRASLILRQETHYLATQIEMQKTHYRELNDRIDEMVRMRHDHRHHMQTLASYLQQQDISLAKEYLQKYMGAEEQKGRIILCRNMLADALLKYYQSLCGRQKIRFECAADLPEEIEMEDTDFTILFGNLLENAWEAAKNMGQNSYIKVQIQDQGNQIIACIENSYDQKLLAEKKGLRSTKHKGMGIGTRSARLVVEKWNGVMEWQGDGGVFRVRLVLPQKCHNVVEKPRA